MKDVETLGVTAVSQQVVRIVWDGLPVNEKTARDGVYVK